MTITIGRAFRMTLKTRAFLWLHRRFHNLGQWFIKHCDVELSEES